MSGAGAKTFTFEKMSIPKSYMVVDLLGEGTYGIIFKCCKRETNEFVAVKTSKQYQSSALWREARMMRTLMSENLDEANIVKFHGELHVNKKLSLEFELLDKTLKKHTSTHPPPRLLNEIRTIIQQLAVAFDALKRVGVIHADLKLDNIMIVNEVEQPLKVKLIDFGLSIFSHQARTGRVIQPHQFRAPEIIFGLPFSEAIDIWSLGCIMAYMVFQVFIFPGYNEYESLQSMMELLGPPPTHLLDGGVRTQSSFKKEWNSWTLKTPGEYWEEGKEPCHDKKHSCQSALEFNSMDDLKALRKGLDDELEDLKQCVDLLKGMLQWDAHDRITPVGILNHPFITRSGHNCKPFKPRCTRAVCHNSSSVPKKKFHSGDVSSLECPNCLGSHSMTDCLFEPGHCSEPTSTTDVENLDLTEDEMREKTKVKKKNFLHLLSWMKKTFTCMDEQ